MRILLSIILSASFVHAWAGSPVKWEFSTSQRSDTVVLNLTASCELGWHIYALDLANNEGPLPTVITVKPDPAFTFAGPVQESTPEEKDDPNFGMRVRYHSGSATFTQRLVQHGRGTFSVDGQVEYMACNDKTCLPPVTVPFSVDVPSQK